MRQKKSTKQAPITSTPLSAQKPSLIVTFTSKIGSTCELGSQSIELTPGASTTCGGSGPCSCTSSCCW